jgi:transposase
MRALSQHVDDLKAPDYTTIWWRVAKMNIDIARNVELDKDVTIAVDSTGIKVSNRGEWIRKVWKVKRGFIKVHVAVDTKTKQILAIEVTKENVGDGKMLGRLVESSGRKGNVRRVLADGAYDSKNNFRMLASNNIEAVIRVRKNASLKGGGCMQRKFAVLEQLGNEDWRKVRGYGYRWMAESAFSSLKRIFGESITSVRWKNIVNELLLKASIYNLFMKMNLN